MLTLTSTAKPFGHHRHHRPVVVFAQPTPPVYYQPVPPPVCQYAPPPPVVVYRPAPYYRNQYRHTNYHRGGHEGRGNYGHHR
jgi:hypothetical protein